jgi:hypothetical protein
MHADAIWTYVAPPRIGMDLEAFVVEAEDEVIGYVEEALVDGGSGYIVINTGPWIFGRKLLLPAGTIRHVDFDAHVISLACDREDMRSAPPFGEDYDQESYHVRLEEYYRQIEMS